MILDQADNNLPLVEKYRPKCLDDIVSHGDIMETLKQFIDKKSLPHLLLHGPAGTGKTSCAQSIVNTVFENDINIIKSINSINIVKQLQLQPSGEPWLSTEL